ncbi:aldehyde dehydrogenase [Corynebacterium durum]|uniref:aldehyde dehydrogenase n=1 Tax=Corynebacterium durum TaxID=61592 RepID=UPI0028EA0448|nr:aldehyde dehydrogenase [Corynebacterium durum]
MSTITLAGDYRSALTHFALYGLAMLTEVHHPGAVTLGWSDEATPKAQLNLEGIDLETVAEYVAQYSTQLASADSWVAVNNEYGSGKRKAIFSPFSPRIRGIDPQVNPDDWDNHQKARSDALDRLTLDSDLLSLRWIAGLGEAAYWRFSNKERRPDHGASRWEMKTRNKGEEFVQYRLRPLCIELSKWSISDISSGITGVTLRDTIGKNAIDSRTSTGFTPPGPADVALTFAALLGIACFPVVRKIDQLSVTPGAWPSDILHPNNMVLPIFAQKITPARLRAILRSQAFAEAVEQVCGVEAGIVENNTASVLGSARSAVWLKDRGVKAVVRFPILLAGSSSAPERQVQYGTAVPL